MASSQEYSRLEDKVRIPLALAAKDNKEKRGHEIHALQIAHGRIADAKQAQLVGET